MSVAKPHIDKTADQGNLQITDSTEESLKSIGDSRQDIHYGNQVQISNTVPDNFLIFHKEHHQMSCKNKTDNKNEDAVNGLQYQSTSEAFTHPVISFRPLILRHKCCHGVGYILLRGIGKVINPVDRGKCSGNRHTHSVNNCLNTDFSELYSCLLHCRCPAVCNCTL